MILLSRSLWLAQTNTYVVASEPGGPAVVVDVPPDPSAVLEMVRRHDLSVAALFVTHGHVDHVGGAGPVAGPPAPTPTCTCRRLPHRLPEEQLRSSSMVPG